MEIYHTWTSRFCIWRRCFLPGYHIFIWLSIQATKGKGKVFIVLIFFFFHMRRVQLAAKWVLITFCISNLFMVSWNLEGPKSWLAVSEKSSLIHFLITTVNTDFQTSLSDKWGYNSDQEVKFKKFSSSRRQHKSFLCFLLLILATKIHV